MLYTKYTAATEARKKCFDGIKLLTEAVGATMGAKGRLAIIQRLAQPPITTKDGVTVANEFVLPDKEQQCGVDLVKIAARKTALQAGDGTTATVVLAKAIIEQGLIAIENGSNAVSVVEEIKKATIEVVNFIKENSIQIQIEVPGNGTDYLKQVATIAANGDSYIGGIIADAYRQIGKNGICQLGTPISNTTEIRISHGLRIETGWTDGRYSTNHHKMVSELDNPLVLIYENKVLDPQHIMRKGGQTTTGNNVVGGILFEIAKLKRPVLFMCDGLDEVSSASLLQAKQNNDLKICVTKLPSQYESRRELLKDIASFTGAQILGTANGIKISEAKVEHCGTAKKVTVGKDYILFEAEDALKESIEARAKILEAQIQESKTDSSFAISVEELSNRLAKLTSGIATIHVGAATEIEQRELNYRVEDAILATKSAIEEGIVEGGGMCLLRAIQKQSSKILSVALKAPFEQICTNAGFKVSGLYNRNSDDRGFNVLSGSWENLLATGIVDAAKVPRCAVQNASSVACQLLLTETMLIQENPEY